MRTLTKQKNLPQRPPIAAPLRHCTSAKYNSLRCIQQGDQWIKIGKYKILLDEVLGRGYSSCVYKGVETHKGLKRYAVKVIQLKCFNSTCLKLFQREIEIHKTLDHQHIVRCYDVFKTETHIYMIMEYCPHGDLSQLIQQKKKLPQNAVIDAMTQILNGYKYLAGLKILHRDLKPSNILRSGKIWKIADFGFAVRAESGFTDSINVGTPMYMPVESLSQSYYSAKTDIFALGIILYEMTHGRPPWSSKSQVELLRKMCNNKLKVESVAMNKRVLEFMVKACEISEQNRLSQDQMRGFSFNEANNSINESPFLHSATYSTSSQPPSEGTINAQILQSELSLCRFLFNMAQHIDCFLIQSHEKANLTVVLYKFLLRNMKALEEGHFGAEKLHNFDQFKTTPEYVLLHQDITNSLAKYQKSYLDQVKSTDIQTIRGVNTLFPELTRNSQPLDRQFFLKLKSYLQKIAKQTARGLDAIIEDDGEEEALPQKIQALQNILILQRILDWRGQPQGPRHYSLPISDYGQSSLRKSDYLIMRKQMKYI